MRHLAFYLSACIGSTRRYGEPRSVGIVHSVRAVGTSLYVYSERVSRAALREEPSWTSGAGTTKISSDTSSE